MKGMSLKVGRKLWFCGEKSEILLREGEKKSATNVSCLHNPFMMGQI